MNADVIVALASIAMVIWCISGIGYFFDHAETPWKGWKFWMVLAVSGPIAWLLWIGVFLGKRDKS